MNSARGFSLIEFLVAIGVIALLLGIGFSAMGPADEGERLRNAQKQLVSDLRTIQNKSYSGELGSTSSTHIATFSGSLFSPDNYAHPSYTIDGEQKVLPKNVGLILVDPDPSGGAGNWPYSLADSVSIYFYHPAKTNYSAFCAGFSCFTRNETSPLANYGLVTVNPIVLRLVLLNSNSTLEKCVKVEGSGTAVSRIYESECDEF